MSYIPDRDNKFSIKTYRRHSFIDRTLCVLTPGSFRHKTSYIILFAYKLNSALLINQIAV